MFIQKLLFYGDPMREASRIGGCARQNNVLPHDALCQLWRRRKILSAYIYPCTLITMYW